MSGEFTIKNILSDMKDKLKRAGVRDYEEDAFLLLNCVKNISKTDLLLNGEDVLEEQDRIKLFNLLHDRLRRIPLQHITGKAYFYGHEFKVNGNVLVPRPDTEILVEEALKVLTGNERVLDMCTGSGCILIACDLGEDNKFHFKEGVGADISEKALNIARKNAENLGADNMKFVCGDLFENVSGTFDVILSNPPYIARADLAGLEPEVRDFDPLNALDGGEDGLVFYRRIAEKAPDFLKNNGYIFLEIGYNQAKDVEDILKENGFSDISIIKDYGGNDRVVKALLRKRTE